MSLLAAGSLWLRQSLFWSNTWSSWQDRLFLAMFAWGGLILLAIGIVAWLWLGTVGWVLLGILATLYVVGLAICTRQGWLKLFGPVLFYDMVCSARRSRYFVMRLLYATLLLSILCMMYLSVFEVRGVHNPDMMVLGVMGLVALVAGTAALIVLLMYVNSRSARVVILVAIFTLLALLIIGIVAFNFSMHQNAGAGERDMLRVAEAKLGETFFSTFMLVQLVLVVLLTPAYVAGAIAEEKDRKTLEFLLATDLLNHEIVLSKLCSRVANLTLFLLTGLPILSVLQFIGGVDVQLMFAGFAGTGLTMLGVASLSILCSTLLKKPRDAIGVTYLVIISYVALGSVAFGMAASGHWFMTTPLWFDIALSDIARVINAGNPLVAMGRLMEAIRGRAIGGGVVNLTTVLPEILTAYACFHVPLAVICVIWSIVRLRAIALKQTMSGTTQKLAWYDTGRTEVGVDAMLWKELHIEGKARGTWMTWIAGGLLVLVTIGSGLLVLLDRGWDMLVNPDALHDMMRSMNIWFRVAGTGVACLMMLMVGVRASTSITNERERDTFDALLTTPLSAENILLAKLISSITSTRIAWLWFGSMIVMALLTGGIHLLAVPIVITAWFVYAVLFAMIGLWYSMACTSSMRSTVLTVLTTLFVGGGHWIVWLICCLPIALLTRFDHPGRMPEYLAKFQAGLTPPFALAWCSYSWEQLQDDFTRRDDIELMISCLIGIFLWGLACLILWYGILIPKFRLVARREELIYGDETVASGQRSEISSQKPEINNPD